MHTGLQRQRQLLPSQTQSHRQTRQLQELKNILYISFCGDKTFYADVPQFDYEGLPVCTAERAGITPVCFKEHVSYETTMTPAVLRRGSCVTV